MPCISIEQVQGDARPGQVADGPAHERQAGGGGGRRQGARCGAPAAHGGGRAGAAAPLWWVHRGAVHVGAGSERAQGRGAGSRRWRELCPTLPHRPQGSGSRSSPCCSSTWAAAARRSGRGGWRASSTSTAWCGRLRQFWGCCAFPCVLNHLAPGALCQHACGGGGQLLGLWPTLQLASRSSLLLLCGVAWQGEEFKEPVEARLTAAVLLISCAALPGRARSARSWRP